MKRLIIALLTCFSCIMANAISNEKDYSFEYQLMSQSQLEAIMLGKTVDFSTVEWKSGEDIYLQLKITKNTAGQSLISFRVKPNDCSYCDFHMKTVSLLGAIDHNKPMYMVIKVGEYLDKYKNEMAKGKFNFYDIKEMKK